MGGLEIFDGFAEFGGDGGRRGDGFDVTIDWEEGISL